MAKEKPTFAKLKLAKNIDVKTIEFNGFEIEVKQYLPINDKLTIISRVLSLSYEPENYSNPIKEDLFGTLEIIYAYTNIAFTEKQKEDPVGLYDIIISSGLADAVIKAIPEIEYKTVVDGINKCVTAIYTHKHSALGIVEAISEDYSSLAYDAETIQKKIADGDNVAFLKDVLTKLG